MKECPTMSSNARTSCFHKSKNPKPQSSKTFSAPAKQSRKPLLSSDCDALQQLTLQRSLMRLFVQPGRKTDDEYENEADDDFCLSPQQPSRLHIMVGKKISSMKTKKPLKAITSRTLNFQDVTHP